MLCQICQRYSDWDGSWGGGRKIRDEVGIVCIYMSIPANPAIRAKILVCMYVVRETNTCSGANKTFYDLSMPTS